ncbi:hypothetical protein GCM10009737_07840 [Nocardioides lentus]|uniref:HTH cro/C1-type domain-containing protein n=1 Tax=Nocardioides lentus TaxID=338077 RepID=A0ABN2P1P9_9ACTN
MPHAFTAFLREQTDLRGWAQSDVVSASRLSRALVSKWLTDDRERLTRLPDRDTVAAFARAFGVSPEFLLGKAVEATGMGYTAGDFVNSVRTASDDDLVSELRRRLAERPADDGVVVEGSFARGTAPSEMSDVDVLTVDQAARRSRQPRRSRDRADRQDAAETGSQERPGPEA